MPSIKIRFSLDSLNKWSPQSMRIVEKMGKPIKKKKTEGMLKGIKERERERGDRQTERKRNPEENWKSVPHPVSNFVFPFCCVKSLLRSDNELTNSRNCPLVSSSYLLRHQLLCPLFPRPSTSAYSTRPFISLTHSSIGWYAINDVSRRKFLPWSHSTPLLVLLFFLLRLLTNRKTGAS